MSWASLTCHFLGVKSTWTLLMTPCCFDWSCFAVLFWRMKRLETKHKFIWKLWKHRSNRIACCIFFWDIRHICGFRTHIPLKSIFQNLRFRLSHSFRPLDSSSINQINGSMVEIPDGPMASEAWFHFVVHVILIWTSTVKNHNNKNPTKQANKQTN